MAKLSPDLRALQELTSVLTFVRAVRKHWPTLVACTALGLGASLFYLRSAIRIYEAVALIEIDPHVSHPLGEKGNDVLDLGASLFMDEHEYYETQYKLIESDRVLGQAARDLGLTTDPEFFPGGSPKAPASLESAIGVLRGRLVVDPQRGSQLVRIKVDDANQARAKRLCNAIANAYVQQNLDVAIGATSDAAIWLNGQLDHVKQDLEKSENALFDFKRDNDLPSTSINEAANMLRVEMEQLDTALTHTRTHKQELLARHAELNRISAEDPADLPSSELLSSGFLTELRKAYVGAREEYMGFLAEGKGESHPDVKKAAERTRVTREALLAEIKNIQGAVDRDLAVATREEGGESGLFEAARQRAVDLNMKEIEFHRLDRWREQNEKLYALLLERLKESDVARMTKANNIRIVDEAVQPSRPIRPRVALSETIGTILGMLLGAAVTWLREQLDSSIKMPEDVEEKLKTTFLGLLPEFDENGDVGRSKGRRKRSRRQKQEPLNTATELIVDARPLSGVAEAARSIRTNLLFMNPDRPFRKLLVTSAAPSEGKTTVACSIAIALAQGGQRVCLVDCDLRRPRMHRIFNRKADAGVTSVLVGDSTLEEVTKPTHIAGLWCVPAGPIPPNPADVLHSERFKRALAELGERFDRVIVDSPPIVAVTDAAIISTLVDGTVFVVRAFSTLRDICQQGLRALRDVDAPVVGAVLNAVNPRRREYTYYYQYYYYRQGYRDHPPSNGGPQSADVSAPN